MMLPDPSPIPELLNATLSANCFGLSAITKSGKPAKLAIVDEDGYVLEAGTHVERAAWLLMLGAWQNFLLGKGYLKVIFPKN